MMSSKKLAKNTLVAARESPIPILSLESATSEAYALQQDIEGLTGLPEDDQRAAILRLRSVLDHVILEHKPSKERDETLRAVANIIIEIGDIKFIEKRKKDEPYLNTLYLRGYSTDSDGSDWVLLPPVPPSSYEFVDTNMASRNGSNAPGNDGFTLVKKEELELPVDFPGSFTAEANWRLPPYGPGHPATYQINPGQPPYNYGYIEAGDGTYQAFSREKALENYFKEFPIQEPEMWLEAYNKKHQSNLKPFDYGDDTDDKVLVCTCLKYDDGREYIQCDNTFQCIKQFYHPECLGMPANLIPTNDDTWYCPDCLREGLGGAKEFAKMAAFYANYNFKKAITEDPGRYIKPWTADALKKNPQTLRDLGLTTLEEAKTTLLDRSRQPVGAVIPTPPQRRPGTLVRTPNKNSWTCAEDEMLVKIVRESYNNGLSGQPFWDDIERQLRARGSARVIGGARNRWMRGLREEYNLDERRKKNANKMTTAIQVAKVTKKKRASVGRYTVSRKADDPAGHVQVINGMSGVAAVGDEMEEGEVSDADMEMDTEDDAAYRGAAGDADTEGSLRVLRKRQ